MSRSDALTWTATGDEDCMGDHDPDTCTTGCQLGDGYEHDLTTEGYSSIAWMLLGGRPPPDDGDCDGPRCALSGPIYTPCTYADCDLELGGGCVLRGPPA